MPFVLDNSVVSGWYLENQANAYTESIGVRLQDDRAVVPAVWELELTNVLRTACVRGRMTSRDAQAVLAGIAMLGIELDRVPVPVEETLELALRYGLSSYDAAYLEPALRLRFPIATLDEALRVAASAAGVGVLEG